MTLDKIREEITIALDMYCDEIWGGILDNTTPGHYGADEIGFEIAAEDMWAYIPDKSFTFKNGTLSFSARIGGSREEDSVVAPIKRTVSGKGSFRFTSSNTIEVTDFKINESIDLYEE